MSIVLTITLKNRTDEDKTVDEAAVALYKAGLRGEITGFYSSVNFEHGFNCWKCGDSMDPGTWLENHAECLECQLDGEEHDVWEVEIYDFHMERRYKKEQKVPSGTHVFDVSRLMRRQLRGTSQRIIKMHRKEK